MSVSLSPLFNGYQSFLTTGLPNNGGFIYTYAAGTTTPQATYTTNGGSIANANPIPLGADGRPPQEIWLTDGLAYKLVVTDALLTTLPSSTFDNITGFVSSNITGANGAAAIGGGAQIVPTIAALRSLLKTSASTTAFVTGTNSTFIYDATDTTSTDNNITVIVASDGGRWKLVVKSSVLGKDAGMVGDNVANDGAALRNLIATSAFASAGGSDVQLKRGTYRVDAAGGYCLNVTNPIYINGDGGIYTAINPALAAVTDSTLKVTPNPVLDCTSMRITGIALHDSNTGNRVGLHGVYCDTQIAGAYLAKFNLRDVNIGQGSSQSGYGFYHFNNPTNNVTGALYGGLFENNNIKGGMRFDSSGDSNSVVHNILTGTGIGVQASLVSGASLLEVQANNITTNGGAFRADAGSRFRFIGNNCENSLPGAAALNNAAVINLAGANGAMYGGVVNENLISGFGTSDATMLLRMRNCRGTEVTNNVLLAGIAGITTGLDIGPDCQDVRVGPNVYGSGVVTQVNDNGVGTMGVVKTATLLNSWVAYLAGAATLKFIKSVDGMVHLYGSIKGGTTTNGTVITTLPAGFRPSEIIRAPIFVNNAGVPQLAELAVDNAGSVTITYVTSNSQVDINLTFPALNLANGTSLE